MAYIFLALYLIVIGLNMVVGIAIPAWVIALLALIAGVLLLADHFGWTVRRKD